MDIYLGHHCTTMTVHNNGCMQVGKSSAADRVVIDVTLENIATIICEIKEGKYYPNRPAKDIWLHIPGLSKEREKIIVGIVQGGLGIENISICKSCE